MRDWAGLLPELLQVICNCISSFEELIAFGRVCSTWRHIAIEHNLGQFLRPVPLLMLPENQQDDIREFYSVTEGKTYKQELPELKGKMCMETKGWIVTVSDKGDMALVHPLTHVVIPLPHGNTSEFYDEDSMDTLRFVQRVLLSSPPKPGDKCALMILHMGFSRIAFWRTGDKSWTITRSNPNRGFQSIEFYRGKFYAMDNLGELWELDVLGAADDCGSVSPKLTGVTFNEEFVDFNRLYLVESAGSLLVVSRNGIYRDDVDAIYGASEFNVCAIDVEQGERHEVKSLGTRAIFLGHNATVSVDTKEYPGLIPNSIYFTDDNFEVYDCEKDGGGKDMGVYNLEDKIIQPHYRGISLSKVCPPVWTFLTSK